MALGWGGLLSGTHKFCCLKLRVLGLLDFRYFLLVSLGDSRAHGFGYRFFHVFHILFGSYLILLNLARIQNAPTLTLRFVSNHYTVDKNQKDIKIYSFKSFLNKLENYANIQYIFDKQAIPEKICNKENVKIILKKYNQKHSLFV